MTIDWQAFPLLKQIDSPADLRAMASDCLPRLCTELREFLCQTLNQCGGHFGSSMGATELTVALHYVFDTPRDKLVWDVGHQAYIHKILTGRRDQLHTIRQDEGLAPFPRRAESDYDTFSVGHSSTSIGAALGMSVAANLKQTGEKSVAIIGDGAMTAGMAFEALNHAGDINADMLVILNDNEMSISNNVGALSNYFARIIAGNMYSKLREGGKKVLQAMPAPMRDFVKHTELHVKDLVTLGITPGSLFSELGFHYLGPIDGHDVNGLVSTLTNLYHRRGPQLLHIVTRKGKGYQPAENDPIKYHAVKPGFYDKTIDNTPTQKPAPTYSNVFGQWLCDMAEEDNQLVGITPAMREGSDLIEFSKRYPERYFDVAIAEQHSVTLAAGMACSGLKPVVAIYSSFLQRAYDQLIHDVAIENLDVTFAIDRAGVVGGDGSTHNGAFDLSYLRCIPNMVVMASSDENETRQMLYTAYQHRGPACVRYPRGQGPGVTIDKNMNAIELGKAQVKRHGHTIALLAFGSQVTTALNAADIINATVVNMRFIKPIDEAMILTMAKQHQLLVTVEENAVAGGAGSAVNEVLLAHNIAIPVLNLGLPDHFIEHGDQKTLLSECGLDAKGIIQAIQKKTKSLNIKHADNVVTLY